MKMLPSGLLFFFDALVNIQQLLTEKLNITGIIATLSPRDKAIITFIENHPGSRSGLIAEQLNIPSPTVKKALAELVAKKLFEKNMDPVRVQTTLSHKHLFAL